MRLHLDREVDAFFVCAPDAIGRSVGRNACRRCPRSPRRCPNTRTGMRRRLLVRVLDHAEQALVLIHTIQRPAGVEHLVPAMLGIGLREHEEFGVGRIAAEFGVALRQIFDLVIGQRQAQPAIRLGQRARGSPLSAMCTRSPGWPARNKPCASSIWSAPTASSRRAVPP
jgi:hypothetical protein